MDEIIVPPPVAEPIGDLVSAVAADMVVVALVVIAIITVAKQVGSVLDRSGAQCLDRPPVQVALHVAPLVLGVALAMTGGVFSDFALDVRAMLGVISGFLAPGIYSMLKRAMPTLMLTKDARQ